MTNNKIGIVCSGGDAPGINNAIYGLVHKLAPTYQILGFYDGLEGIYLQKYLVLDQVNVEGIQLEGSAIIGCERFAEFNNFAIQAQVVENLKALNIQHLVVFGGNGSLMAAKILVKQGIKVHFIPTTIDNDVVEVKTTLGFDTALNSVVEFIRRVNYSAKNHKKVQVYELMGRECSDLTNSVGQAVYADYVINNQNFTNPHLVAEIVKALKESNKRTNIILLSEKLLQTQALITEISAKISKRIWFTIIGHFQRGGTPSFGDCHYGAKCVDKIVKNIQMQKANLIYSLAEEVVI
ncbi:6-phosphofructokinase [Spiroplasma clarkii]|uniref:6-phosphofructokinase n=1 Tax=Spiroplasma clarkii TaxID=2139 RepID=A0A1Y0L228_9MOLU|nr:6-phosphofructokinase [Spiroplasma clarkii]ARU91785.1 6-phosphofructokinase [Spiroplasma clarkii]ATX71152.1 6-phosphofructokinase [Spiroplasma clarkii]